MKEYQIRNRALAESSICEYVCWKPPKVKYQETDIFGIGDLICWKGKKVKLIQLTSRSNVSARTKKCLAFIQKNKVEPSENFSVEVWGYDQRQKTFLKRGIGCAGYTTLQAIPRWDARSATGKRIKNEHPL